MKKLDWIVKVNAIAIETIVGTFELSLNVFIEFADFQIS